MGRSTSGIGRALGGLIEVHCVVIGRDDDFQNFQVIGKTQHRVFDAWRLQPAAALFHQKLAMAFELTAHPTFEHINHLVVHVVKVAVCNFCRVIRFGAAVDMHIDHATRGFNHAHVS